jgi:hypothetical protein
MRNGILRVVETPREDRLTLPTAANDPLFDPTPGRSSVIPMKNKMETRSMRPTACTEAQHEDYWLGGYAGI